MKRVLWIAVVGVMVLAVAYGLLARARGPEWTTTSSSAMSEFDAALEAWMKLYYEDSVRHLEKALELDPDFVGAKVFLADMMRREHPERSEELINSMADVDMDRLTPRERLFVERSRAALDHDSEKAQQLLDRYLEEHPRDPFAIHLKASWAWVTGRAQLAERLNRQLIELSPNWVLAYNQLGYLTMQQGRFAEAEEYFKSYRFVAPDQANPHDSLGELYITTGRYDDAAASFESAIGIRPDFWPSYEHLVMVRSLQGDTSAALEVIERAARQGCPEYVIATMKCDTTYSEMERSQAWGWILDEADRGCLDTGAGSHVTVVSHLAACRMGRYDEARELEARVAARVEKKAQERDPEDEMMKTGLKASDPMLRHLVGVRVAIQGDLEPAIEELDAADEKLTYREAPEAIFKLYNRLCLVEVLRAVGRHADAYKLLAKVHEVNPQMGREFEDMGFEILGLPGRAPLPTDDGV
jgi:tetratricopeptide (TPR) repeat protein